MSVLAPAQAQTTGMIEGIVRDPSGALVAGVSLRLTEINTSAVRGVTADSTGYYQALRLAPGAYQLVASHSGFRDQVRRGIELGAGATARVDLTLQLGEARDQVVVVADAAPVNVSPAAWGDSVRQQELETLPLNGRDVFELSTREAGVNLARTADRTGTHGPGLKITVKGARPTQNSFLLDGIHSNDSGSSVPAGASGNLLGLEGIRELRVVSSPFSAEYGRAAGAVFTAVSKSGSNELHGSLYEFLRHSALDARNFFDDPAAPIPPLRRNQFGGLLSGPVRRNKLFFLANYEALRETLTSTVRPNVPSLEARRGVLTAPGGGARTVTVSPKVQPYLDLYPLPNGRDFGDGTAEFVTRAVRETREDYLAGKSDLLVSPALRLSGRYTFDDAVRGAPDPLRIWRFSVDSRYQFLHTEAQHLVSPRTIHTLRAAFSRTRNEELSQPRPDIPASRSFVQRQSLGTITVAGLADFGGMSARTRPRRHILNDFQFNDDLIQTRGRHTLRLGGAFDRLRFNQVADYNAVGQYTFSSLADFLEARPRSGDVMVPGSDTSRGWRQNLFFAYAQEEFRAGPRLSVSLGLRYEFTSTPGEVHGKVATLRDPLRDATVTLGGPIYRNPSAGNVAPRASIALDPFGSGRAVLRAGAGVFLDLVGIRDVLVAGVRMPPFFDRVNVTRPSFPDLLQAARDVAPLSNPDALDYYLQQPYVAQIQFAIERQMGSFTVARLGYAYTRGVHLMGFLGNVNNARPQVLPDGRIFFPADAPPINPAFGQIALRRSQFNAFYHGLSVGLERKWRGGLGFQWNYTWGKSLDETSNSISTDFDNGDGVPTTFNYRQNRGPSDFDLRHAFNASLSYDIPAHPPGAAGRWLRGWGIQALTRIQTGNPFSPSVGFDRARLLVTRIDLGQRPDFIGQPGDRIILGDPAQYFDPLAFGLPEAGFLGNLGRGTLTGPGLVAIDVGLHKALWQTERHSLRLRLEAFNATNHPNFVVPSGLALFDSTLRRLGTAGRITETSTSSRQVQLALKWLF
jgi:hypothetical protein